MTQPLIKVKVYAPSTPDPITFEWPKSKKVGEAAAEAAAEFGHTGGNA